MLIGRGHLPSLTIAGAVVGIFLFACGNDRQSRGFDDSPRNGVLLPSDPVDGGSDTGSGSADLQSVLTTQGNVVACPPAQGCAKGKCVPACDATADSKGSLGCAYRVATPSFTREAPCFAVFVAN